MLESSGSLSVSGGGNASAENDGSTLARLVMVVANAVWNTFGS
jgi:hypothetical protein